MIRDAKMQLLSCNFHSTVAKKEPRREGVHTVLKMQQKVVFTHYNFRYFWLQNSKISKSVKWIFLARKFKLDIF